MVLNRSGAISVLGLTALATLVLSKNDECKAGEWRCGDLRCARAGAACDGTVHCADGSDEALELCRGTKRPLLGLLMLCAEAAEAYAALCPEACRRWPEYCSYALMAEHGAPGTCAFPPFPSIGSYSVTDIIKRGAGVADFSLSYSCPTGYRLLGHNPRCKSGAWTADFPNCILATSPGLSVAFTNEDKCGGTHFKCADGACVDQSRRCDGVLDCADGSDERGCPNNPGGKQCVLPPYPQNGQYSVLGDPSTGPGRAFDFVSLNYSCNPGYIVVGKNTIICYSGIWSDVPPRCERFCKLAPHPSVKYVCKVTGANSLSVIRLCHDVEPSGTIVVPRCNIPNYSYSGVLPNMHCIDGTWDYVAICKPECGTPILTGNPLIINGVPAYRGELPWHAGIYSKKNRPYRQICGGSLVSTTVVISAAHCFWDDNRGLQPHSDYAVALGKVYRPWDDAHDPGVQKSDVLSIMVPPLFIGAAGNFQEDIALVFLVTAIVYVPYIRPVCIDFDVGFDKHQLQSNMYGKVSGWGMNTAVRGASPVLVTTELPYVETDQCLAILPHDFRPYITGDKFCAGTKNGSSICKGDSGGGLAFPASDRDSTRYYLRGIMSTAPRDSFEDFNLCASYATFTHILRHEAFIKKYLN